MDLLGMDFLDEVPIGKQKISAGQKKLRDEARQIKELKEHKTYENLENIMRKTSDVYSNKNDYMVTGNYMPSGETLFATPISEVVNGIQIVVATLQDRIDSLQAALRILDRRMDITEECILGLDRAIDENQAEELSKLNEDFEQIPKPNPILGNVCEFCHSRGEHYSHCEDIKKMRAKS